MLFAFLGIHPAMSNFWVVENAGGGWDIKEERVQDPVSHHDTQAAAIKAAHPLIIDTGGGELIVQDRHGKIRQKDTIGKRPVPAQGLSRSATAAR